MSLKDFVIIAKLGEGAYSSVYKVQRHADSEIYALKKVKMNNLSDKEQENALNQVRILASIKCPFIVGYKHAFIESKSLCIVMQFSDDGDLYQKIVQQQKNKTNFSQQIIWKTIIQVVIGLKSLHDLNIFHRDLKSANVFLSKDGTAKLGDMNVSKIAKEGLLYTQTGTPYYASPEVWKDKPYDSKSDIWSLGCVIYQMATLKPPFRAQDMDGLYKRVIKGSYQKIGDQYSKSLSSVIKSMLQVNPSSRPTAQQLLKNLSNKMEQFDLNQNQQIDPKQQLLRTIRVQKNLHYLTDSLPKSNYQNGHQYEKAPKSFSTKPSSPKKIAVYQKGINLPRLDKIIVRNNTKNVPLNSQPKQVEQKQVNNIDMSNMLRIEGKSNSPKYDYKYINDGKKNLDRDLKAELRKIYNIRPSPSKKVREIKNNRKNGRQLPTILPRIN